MVRCKEEIDGAIIIFVILGVIALAEDSPVVGGISLGLAGLIAFVAYCAGPIFSAANQCWDHFKAQRVNAAEGASYGSVAGAPAP